MKKLLLMTAIGFSVFTLAACGSDDSASDGDTTAKSSETKTDYELSREMRAAINTRADFMEYCESYGSNERCNCEADYYEGVGISWDVMADPEKLREASVNLKPEQVLKFSSCQRL